MKMLSACLLLLPFISCTQVQDTKNDAVIEQKIETLLSSMTLEEKIGQMNQISSYGNIEDMSGLIKKGEVGSILNEVIRCVSMPCSVWQWRSPAWASPC